MAPGCARLPPHAVIRPSECCCGALAHYFTLGSRIAREREIYGLAADSFTFSLLGFVLSLAEVTLVGLAVGLVFEAGGERRPVQRTLGASILLVYIVAHGLVEPVGATRMARQMKPEGVEGPHKPLIMIDT